MGAVRAAERVVHVDVRQPGELLGEGGIVVFLLGVEAQVLEEEDAAGGEGGDRRGGGGADAVFGEGDGGAEESGERVGDGAERHVGDALAVGPPEMRHQDHLRVLAAQVVDGRERFAQALVRFDLAVLQGNVEVDAHDDALVGDGEVLDEEFHGRRV